jgi:TonB-dependent SusC/RagA subfamily outer membrane receptor
MHPKKALLVVFTMVLFTIVTNAQSPARTISGTVTSDDQLPLESVSIKVKTRNKGTYTKKDGSFSLEIANNDRQLLISSAGFEEQELPLSESNTYNIVLKKATRQLEDIVVTGYSTQRKRFIAGSITTIGGDEIRNLPATGFNQLLQGKSAGVQVAASSGVPGGGITFRIRGSNSINASSDPLYVIDGVFVSNAETIQTSLGSIQQTNPLATINPNDIESITILKDANATAIYGSLGANGVVIVTTRRGKLNTKAKITLNTYQGWSYADNKYMVPTGL